MDAIRLYFRYIAISIRSQMQYRTSFVLLTLGQFIVIGGEFLCVWALFARFESVRGWHFPEAALLYGMTSIGFAVAHGASRGFDLFDRMIKRGDFDRLLLRPRSTAFQVAAQEVVLGRVGRIAQGLLILLVAGRALELEWTAARIGLLLLTIAGGACMFYGLFVLQATLAFWTTESLEIVNAVTYGGSETAQYPLSIYRPWFRKIFTFVVPLACVSYFPALAILGRDDPVVHSPVWFRWSAPLVGVIFLAACLRVWRFGVRHYRSTGS